MSRQGTVSSSDITEMKNMIGSLADSVKALSERQAAPGVQIRECQKLTDAMKFEQRCLKREREGDGKKQGVIKQQNLLDELACQVKRATDAVAGAQVYAPKDPNANMTKPAQMELVDFDKTPSGEEISTVLTTVAKLLSARLLELCVVSNASSVSVGWATVESLSGASYGDYCEDEKQSLRVKEALAEQEKRAQAAADRAQKERDRSLALSNGTRRYRQMHKQVQMQMDDVPPAPPAQDFVPPPPPSRGGSIRTVMRPSVASAGLPARGFFDHSANDLCYRCQKTGHKSFECPNPPAPGRR